MDLRANVTKTCHKLTKSFVSFISKLYNYLEEFPHNFSYIGWGYITTAKESRVYKASYMQGSGFKAYVKHVDSANIVEVMDRKGQKLCKGSLSQQAIIDESNLNPLVK